MNSEDSLVVPDLIRENLKVLFVGINPGMRSAEIRHHFAGHSNRFWKLLAESGLTPVKLRGEEDFRMLEFEYGITNIVPRPSAAAAELEKHEFLAGAKILRKKLEQYRPKVAAYLGKDVYRHLCGRREFLWGRQQESLLPEITDYVLPNPSGLNRMPFSEQAQYYRELLEAL